MEADWEVEIGPDAPVIELDWTGRLDLRTSPHLAHQLPEAAALPGLGDVLVQLNGEQADWLTSKCDVWPVDEFDRDELDAPVNARVAWACYIDFAPVLAQRWSALSDVTAWCTAVCTRAHAVPLRSCRADLVVRQAAAHPRSPEAALAATAYVTACGESRSGAHQQLAAAAAALARIILAAPLSPRPEEKLQ